MWYRSGHTGDDMSYENISAAFGVLLTLLNGWLILIVRSNREEMAALRDADAKLTQGLSSIRELLVGHYVERAEFKADMKEQSAQFKDVIERAEARLTAALSTATAAAAAAAATASAAAVAAAISTEHNKR
jgi:hypothetical protein